MSLDARLCTQPTDSYFRFILPSAQRFFMASDSRLLPSGVSPPRLRFFVVLPLGLPMRFLAPGDTGDETDPRSAAMTRLSRSRSFVKSETTFARSKVRLSFCRERDFAHAYDSVVAIEITRSRYLG
jgi:hypothetical protein